MIMTELGGMAVRLTQQARKDAAAKVEYWQQVINPSCYLRISSSRIAH